MTTERERCFYCGDPVIASRIERDHFPKPASAGGTETVVSCPQCHDLKDRTKWNDLTLEMRADFMEDFFRMGRAGKIVVAQLLRAAYEATAKPSRPSIDQVCVQTEWLGDVTDVPLAELAANLERLILPLLRDGIPVTLKPVKP